MRKSAPGTRGDGAAPPRSSLTADGSPARAASGQAESDSRVRLRHARRCVRRAVTGRLPAETHVGRLAGLLRQGGEPADAPAAYGTKLNAAAAPCAVGCGALRSMRSVPGRGDRASAPSVSRPRPGFSPARPARGASLPGAWLSSASAQSCASQAWPRSAPVPHQRATRASLLLCHSICGRRAVQWVSRGSLVGRAGRARDGARNTVKCAAGLVTRPGRACVAASSGEAVGARATRRWSSADAPLPEDACAGDAVGTPAGSGSRCGATCSAATSRFLGSHTCGQRSAAEGQAASWPRSHALPGQR
jgi:hypothetical protein